jgi:UrcA family protein
MTDDEVSNDRREYDRNPNLVCNGASFRAVIVTCRKALTRCSSPMLAAFAISTTVSSAQAHRSEPLEIYATAGQVTHEVGYADLDLASRAGDHTLERRVSSAVNSVCNEAAGADEFSHLLCSSEAWGLAWPQVVRAEARARESAQTGTSLITATAVTVRN